MVLEILGALAGVIVVILIWNRFFNRPWGSDLFERPPETPDSFDLMDETEDQSRAREGKPPRGRPPLGRNSRTP